MRHDWRVGLAEVLGYLWAAPTLWYTLTTPRRQDRLPQQWKAKP